MIERNIEIGIGRQCELLGIHRSGLYYAPLPESKDNLHYMRLLDEQYLKTPFYGIRRITRWLKKKGFKVNRKRVKRLMGLMGWQTLYRKPNTSWKNKENKIYPYLLKDLKIDHQNQVWGIDITYVPMRRGFMYLCAIIDLHTRYVINWGISNTMTAEWCCQLVEEAIEMHGKPEIMNSDQGSQFTSLEYIELLSAKEIKISMDGKGRAIDNIFIERNHDAAENAAIMYSLLGCCAASDVNPREWLTDVLTRIPYYNNDYSLDLADLLPQMLANASRRA